MRLITILALFAVLPGVGAWGQQGPGCSATDYAPGSILLIAQPASGAKTLRSIPRDEAPSLVSLDAIATVRGDWLKVRAGASTGWVSAKDVTCRLSPDAAREAVARQAGLVMTALKGRQIAELGPYVHPVRGLRLSPYGTADTKTDKVFTAAQLKGAFENPQTQVWGRDDGSGRPIRLTFAQYYKKFLYDRDFAQAPQITFNAPDEGAGKVWETYPNAIVVDYHYPENEQTAAESLRLVFERHSGNWYLAGIIHDGWSV